jgi:hypothetical protein
MNIPFSRSFRNPVPEALEGAETEFHQLFDLINKEILVQGHFENLNNRKFGRIFENLRVSRTKLVYQLSNRASRPTNVILSLFLSICLSLKNPSTRSCRPTSVVLSLSKHAGIS